MNFCFSSPLSSFASFPDFEHGYQFNNNSNNNNNNFDWFMENKLRHLKITQIAQKRSGGHIGMVQKNFHLV